MSRVINVVRSCAAHRSFHSAPALRCTHSLTRSYFSRLAYARKFSTYHADEDADEDSGSARAYRDEEDKDPHLFRRGGVPHRFRQLELRDVDADISLQELRELFADYGRIFVKRGFPENEDVDQEDVVFFITLETPAATNAILLEHSRRPFTLRGRPIHLETPPDSLPVHLMTASSRLFVSNVPPGTTPEEIRAVFDPVEPLYTIDWPSTPQSQDKRGHVYLRFHSVEDAILVMEFQCRDAFMMGDTKLWLQFAENDKVASPQEPPKVIDSNVLYVSKFPADLTSQPLYDTFNRFGKIKDIRYNPQNKVVNGKTHAFIEFASAKSVQNALEEHSRSPILQPDGTPFAVHPAAKSNAPTQHSSTLHVTGWEGDQKTLSDLLKPYVTNIKRVTIKTKLPTERSIAFIEFDTIENATKVRKALSGTEAFPGVFLSLSYARPYEPRPGVKIKSGDHYGLKPTPNNRVGRHKPSARERRDGVKKEYGWDWQ